MTIVIKEIQVKTTVEKNPVEQTGVTPEWVSRLKQEILEEVMARKLREIKKER